MRPVTPDQPLASTKTNKAANARLMKYMPSTRPTIRNIVVYSRPCTSGWRAMPAIVWLPGEAVADGRANGATAERHAAADEGARQLDGLLQCLLPCCDFSCLGDLRGSRLRNPGRTVQGCQCPSS